MSIRPSSASVTARRNASKLGSETWEAAIEQRTVDAKLLKRAVCFDSPRVDASIRQGVSTASSPTKAPRGSTKTEASKWEQVVDQQRAALAHAKQSRDFGWTRDPVGFTSGETHRYLPPQPPKRMTKEEAEAWSERLPVDGRRSHEIRYEFSMGGSRVAKALTSEPVTSSPAKRADRLTTKDEANQLAKAVEHKFVDAKTARFKFCYESPHITDAIMGRALDEARGCSDVHMTRCDENPVAPPPVPTKLWFTEEKTSTKGPKLRPADVEAVRDKSSPRLQAAVNSHKHMRSNFSISTMQAPSHGSDSNPLTSPIQVDRDRWFGQKRGEGVAQAVVPPRTMMVKQLQSTFTLG